MPRCANASSVSALHKGEVQHLRNAARPASPMPMFMTATTKRTTKTTAKAGELVVCAVKRSN